MSKTKIISLVVAGALALVAVGGALTYNQVLAQAPTPQATPGPRLGGRGGPPDGALDADLAAALGITVEKLQAAYQAANAEALKLAVSKGLITQAQADQITANGVPNHPPRGFGRPGVDGIDPQALLAKALGITTDQLQAAQQKAQNARLDAAVKSGQLTQAQVDEMKGRAALFGNAKFQASMKAAFEAGVKQAVTDGVITQAQADQILKLGAGIGPSFLGGPGGPGGRPGGPGGPGGPKGNPGTAPQNQPTKPSSQKGR